MSAYFSAMKLAGYVTILSLWIVVLGCNRNQTATETAAANNAAATNSYTLLTAEPATNNGAATSPSDTITTNFPVRGVGLIQMTIPHGWIATARQSETNRLPTTQVLITSSEPNNLTVEFTALLVGAQIEKVDLRNATEKTLRHAAPSALEKELAIESLRGPQHSGYYFSLTDKNLVDRMPAPGDFKYMIQGTGKLSQFATSFTILSNNPDAKDRLRALEMIRSIQFVHR